MEEVRDSLNRLFLTIDVLPAPPAWEVVWEFWSQDTVFSRNSQAFPSEMQARAWAAALAKSYQDLLTQKPPQ